MASRVRGLDFQMKLVGDIRRGKDAEQRAQVVATPTKSERTPRVDIKLDVETYEAQGKVDRQTVASTPTSHGGPVAAGGGVLGFLMAEKSAAPKGGPDLPTGAARMPADLARFKGFDVTLTLFDPEEFDSLEAAMRKGMAMDVSGVLDEASDARVVLKNAGGRDADVDLESWTVGEAKVARGEWSWRSDDVSGSLAGLDDALVPGAPVLVRVMGERDPLHAKFVGTGRDERDRLVLDVVDASGQAKRLQGSDVYDVLTKGFSFTALERS